jgi:hypothetical protein
VTGKEAIHAIRALPVEDVEGLMKLESTDATTRFVCWMRLRDPEGWRGLLGELKLLDMEPISATDRAVHLWRQDFWTDDALAKETGLKGATLKALRRTRFRQATWSSRSAGHYQRAYHLVSG